MSKLEIIAPVGSEFILKCLFTLFKAILLKMEKIEVNLACIYVFAFLSLWLEVSWFLVTTEKSDVAGPVRAGLAFCLGSVYAGKDVIWLCCDI